MAAPPWGGGPDRSGWRRQSAVIIGHGRRRQAQITPRALASIGRANGGGLRSDLLEPSRCPTGYPLALAKDEPSLAFWPLAGVGGSGVVLPGARGGILASYALMRATLRPASNPPLGSLLPPPSHYSSIVDDSSHSRVSSAHGSKSASDISQVQRRHVCSTAPQLRKQHR